MTVSDHKCFSPAASISVCVFAHNEEANILGTLSAICDGNDLSRLFPIYVYANGCTDRTVELVEGFAKEHSNVHLRVLPVASKPNAWNMAFSEQKSDIIIFSDGDVVPEKGAALKLVVELGVSGGAVIATCRQVVMDRGLSYKQKIVGYLQTPLFQDFLAGGFYAVRRSDLAALFSTKGFKGLPSGVVGEDAFLDYLVGSERVIVSECRSAYIPPDLSDYCRYLARLRWQNEQIRCCWENILPRAGSFSKIYSKLRKCGNYRRLGFAIVAVISRCIFKFLNGRKIRKFYRGLGPLRVDGAEILSCSTRSSSTKQ